MTPLEASRQAIALVRLTWNPGVPDGGLMEKIADGYGEFALTECRQKLGTPT